DQAPPSGAIGANAGGNGGADSVGPDQVTPNPDLKKVPPDPAKPTPDVIVTRADDSAYRGGTIRVQGLVRVGTQGIANHRVDGWLSPAGQNGHSAEQIGVATTGPDGTFDGEFNVPGKLNLANYEVHLTVTGDAYYNGAQSE